MYLFKVMKSSYCQGVFWTSLIVSYFLIPKTVFNGLHYILAIFFMATFSLSIVCIVRSIKEKAILAKKSKASTINIIAIILGVAVFQVCGVGIPACGFSIGMSILLVVFPQFFIKFLTDYSTILISLAIILQIISLYYMGCFINIEKKKPVNHCQK